MNAIARFMESHPQAKKWWDRLCDHGAMYWLVALGLTIFGIFSGIYIEDHRWWTDMRYRATQVMQDVSVWIKRPLYTLYPKRTALVFVGDQEYWSDELAGRSPIKRDYLARLIDAVDKAGADVIALDFDLRAPLANPSRDFPAYVEENTQLVDTIQSLAARHRHIVLATSIKFAGANGYQEQGNVYDDHGIFPAVSSELCPTISRGYVQLPYDIRRVPLPLPLDTDPSSTVESLATAIVKCVDPVAYARTVNSGKDELPFAGYIPLKNFPLSRAGQEGENDKQEGMSASEVLGTRCATERCLHGKIVIISGNWNSRAFDVGPRVDLHGSPVGIVPGAMIHANYVEAMLSDRAFSPLPKWLVRSVEILAVVLLTLVLALISSGWLQFAAVVGTTLFMLVLNFFLQDLGMFFDFFVPTVMLLGHVVAHKIYEWWKIAHQPVEAAAHV
jgi:CHASE2 domain-containing protein